MVHAGGSAYLHVQFSIAALTIQDWQQMKEPRQDITDRWTTGITAKTTDS